MNGQTAAQLNLNNIQTSSAGRYSVTVNNGCSPNITSNEFNVTVSGAPTIQTQPVAQQEICINNNFTLSVIANNAQTYQWFKNDVAINAATANSYSINAVTNSDAGTYKVVVSSSCGYNVTGNAAVLVVKSAPTILTAASNNTLCVGDSRTLEVTALPNNGGTLTYQWKKAGVDIPNETAASLALTNVQIDAAATYTVAVTNSCSTTLSRNFVISVNPSPVITVNPLSLTRCVGEAATFTANATGYTSIRWQKNGVDIDNTSTSLSISPVSATDAGIYTFLATNNCTTVRSTAATLAVNNKPVINSLTTTSPVCAGNTATITSSVNPNGDNNLTYSWRLNGSPIQNSNTSILSIPNFQSSNAGVYSLVVTNSCGSTTSSSTTSLQLQPKPTYAKIDDQTVCVGRSLNIAPVYSEVSGSTVTYQWYFEGNPIPNKNTAQLNINNIQTTQAGRYFVTVNNGCSPESNNSFNVTVLNLPTIQTQPTAQQQLCVGSNFALSVVDNYAETYKWFKNNVEIPGETSKTYTKNISASDAGTYKVLLSNSCGYSISSNNAILSVSLRPTITSSPVNSSVCVGQPVTASVSANTNGGGNLRYAWTTVGNPNPLNINSTFLIPNASLDLNGKVYTVTVTNDCGTENGGSFTLNVGEKPTVSITTSIPDNTTTGKPTVCLGSAISFSVSVESNGYSPTYTWYKDDISKGTSTSSSLLITSSSITDAGTYKLSVANTCGVVTSTPITVGVHEKPIFVTQPNAAVTACEASSITLSGLAQNKPGTNSEIIYTWYRNNAPIQDAILSKELKFTNIAVNAKAIYKLSASNECGAVFSDNSDLTVVSKPRYNIITPSSEFSICSATNQTKTLALNIFTVNGLAPSITWSTKDGSITGNTNSASITIASVGKDATYTAVLSNGCGDTTLKIGTAEGILIKNEVSKPVVIENTMPPNTTFCENDQIILNIKTNSNGPETYIWKLNGVVKETKQSGNVNSSDYTKSPATLQDLGAYTVDINNSCGTMTTPFRFDVIVNPRPTVAFDVSSASSQCLNNNRFVFNNRTSQTGGGEIKYAWDFGDGSINTTDISPAKMYSNSGTYSVILRGTNSYGCANTATRNIIVLAQPRITSQPIGKIVCQGATSELAPVVNLGGATSVTYQWYLDSVAITAGGNTLKYTIPSMSLSNAGRYYLKVSNAQCSLDATSEIAVVNYQEKPNASFTTGGKSLSTCVNDADYTFINTTPDVANVSYLWETSNGTTSNDKTFRYKFTNTGIYNVTLTATAGGCSSTMQLGSTASTRIRVNGLPTITKDLESNLTVKRGDLIAPSVEATSLNADGSTANVAQIFYSWYKLPSTIIIGDKPTFDAITKAVISDSGRYYVNVSNGCGVIRSNILTINVIDKPTITIQPVPTIACIDKPLQLSVVATSNDNSSPLYQWYHQNDLNATPSPVPGGTGPILNIAKFEFNMAGHYYVTLTNSVGDTTSSKVIVTANEKPSINSFISMPSIESGICINTRLQLNATVSNIANSPNVISWEQNGVNITGQSTLQLTISEISKANQGDITLKVANACGTESKKINVNVIDLPQFSQSPTAVTTCVNGSATFTAKVQAITNGTPFGFQWLWNGATYRKTGIVSDEQLILSNLQPSDVGYYSLQASNSCGIKESATGKLSVISTGPTITQQPTEVISCSGTQNVVSVVATSENNTLSYSWYKNGILIADQISNQLIFPKISTTDIGNYKSVIQNSCGLSTTSNEFKIVVNEKVTLKSSIENKQICVGSDLEVDISGNLNNADLSTSYQWKLNGINILAPSARTNRIQLLSATKPIGGKYSILATNNCGANILDLFTLGVTNLPTILTHPIEGNVCENQDWSNKVEVSNTDQIGFAYQWYKDAIAISGANQPSVLVANANSSNRGVYSVKLSSACGDVTSQGALLQIRPKPQVDISLLGTAPMQCIDNNLFTFKPSVTIADNSIVDLTWDFGDGVYSKQSQVSHRYDFANDFNVYLFAKSTYGCSDTAKQVVTVNSKPVIYGNINNQILCLGGQLNYNVDVRVKPNELIGYQWYFNQDPIPNAVNKSISIDDIQNVNAGNYKLRITNACGISYSNEAELKIADKPLVTIPLPINFKVCEGTETVLQPTIYSLLPNTFQWYKNELPFVGRRSDTLRIKQFGRQDIATYSVSISNKCGTTFANPGNLIMKNLPKSVQALVSDTICYQTKTVLTIKDFTNNDDTLLFSWFKDEEKLIGIDAKEYSINKFNINDTGYYVAKLINSCGEIIVPIAKLTLNKVDAAFSLDTIDACKGSLIINGLDTTRSLFAVRDNYWQIKELNRTIGSTPAMKYQFTNSGTYTVRHAVTDIKGCNSDTVSKVVVNYGKPTASFTINDTCMTMPSIALNSSVFGYASTKLTKYTWNFGDTTIIRNTNVVPIYTYKTGGYKSLQLIVESDSSCVADTLIKKMMVYGNPVASFVTQDSCQGFPVLFTNKSFTPFLPDSVVNFKWNFDDGNTSTIANPENIFKQYGAYNIKLTAYSATCPFLSDDTTINMTIKNPRANQVYPRIQTVKRLSGQLNAIDNGRSYAWSPFIGLTNSKIKNPKFNLTDDKVTYTITIVDSAGCVNNDKQEVWAFNKPDIYLATGFSPNNDGVNDKYKPEYIEIKILEYFRVQDSNNRQVFITNKITDKWDGTYNGNSLPPAPYLVTVAGIDILGNRIVKQGIVIVVK